MVRDMIKMNTLLDYYGSLLSEKQEKTLRMYYSYDYSLSEIAEILDISKQAVSNNIKRGEENLRFYEDELKLVDKNQKTVLRLEELKTLFEKFRENSSEFDEELLERIEQIVFDTEEVW